MAPLSERKHQNDISFCAIPATKPVFWSIMKRRTQIWATVMVMMRGLPFSKMIYMHIYVTRYQKMLRLGSFLPAWHLRPKVFRTHKHTFIHTRSETMSTTLFEAVMVYRLSLCFCLSVVLVSQWSQLSLNSCGTGDDEMKHSLHITT